MDYIKLIYTCASLALSLLLALIATINRIKVLKSKNKSILSELDIENILIEFIEDVEVYKNYSGKEKKEYVLTKLTKYLIDNNIKIDLQKIDEKLENFIKLTNNVNVNKMINKKNYD